MENLIIFNTMITAYQKEFLSASLALWIGSANRNNIPDTVRCLGVIVEDEMTLRCFVAEKFSEKFLKDISENKQIALSTSHPFTFIGYQYKGEVLEIRPCSDEEIDFQIKYVDEFAVGMAAFGLDKQKVIDMYYFQPSVAIRMIVNKIFEQTPKQNTGGEAQQ